MNATRFSYAVTSFTLSILVGCGGGGGGGDDVLSPTGGSSATTATTTTTTTGVAGAAEGLWRQLHSSATATYTLVEPDGQFWGFPNVTNLGGFNSTIIKGKLTTTGETVDGTYFDLNLLTCTVFNCKLSGIASSTSLNINDARTFNGVAGAPAWTFSSTNKEASYSVQSTLSQVAGTWNMTAWMPSNGSATGTLVIGSNGSMNASNIGGCGFVGSITPVTGKGYFRLTLSSLSGSCSTGVTASAVNGVAYVTTLSTYAPVFHVQWHIPSNAQYFWGEGGR